LFLRLIPLAANLIGLAELVAAAAFRHRLPFLDDARARLHAIIGSGEKLLAAHLLLGRRRRGGAGSEARADQRYSDEPKAVAEPARILLDSLLSHAAIVPDDVPPPALPLQVDRQCHSVNNSTLIMPITWQNCE